jgi:heptosyltransferase-3
MFNKILFIRRDNIGDLICTTPAIHAARMKYPKSKIGILVNTYNADVIKNNPDIDEIYIYEKAKHSPDKSKMSVWLSNLKVLRKIRKENYDVAIGCGSYSPRLERYTFITGAKKRIGYIKNSMKKSKFYTTPMYEQEKLLHEVEKTYYLLTPLGISSDNSLPPLKIYPSIDELNKFKNFIETKNFIKEKYLVAFHISSRRPENRWPAEKFIELGNLIAKNIQNAQILLLWSPGSEKNPYHPGDDEKAEIIKNNLRATTFAYKTENLKELIAALSICNLLVCCDGGAMHIGTALDKPIIALWGSSDADRWKPWSNKHIVLQGKDKKASNVNVEEVFKNVKNFLE